jgi:hypothetical protein
MAMAEIEERRGRRVRLAIILAVAVVVVGGGWWWRRVDQAAGRKEAHQMEATLEGAAAGAQPAEVRTAAEQALVGDYRALDRLRPADHLEVTVPGLDEVWATYRIRDHGSDACFRLVLSTRERRANRVERC